MFRVIASLLIVGNRGFTMFRRAVFIAFYVFQFSGSSNYVYHHSERQEYRP